MKACAVYTNVKPQGGQNIMLVGFAPLSEKEIVLTWTFESGFESRATVERSALSAMLRELNCACLRLGQQDFDDTFSESEALRVENRRLRVRLDELVYENASLKEKSEA